MHITRFEHTRPWSGNRKGYLGRRIISNGFNLTVTLLSSGLSWHRTTSHRLLLHVLIRIYYNYSHHQHQMDVTLSRMRSALRVHVELRAVVVLCCVALAPYNGTLFSLLILKRKELFSQSLFNHSFPYKQNTVATNSHLKCMHTFSHFSWYIYTGYYFHSPALFRVLTMKRNEVTCWDMSDESITKPILHGTSDRPTNDCFRHPLSKLRSAVSLCFSSRRFCFLLFLLFPSVCSFHIPFPFIPLSVTEFTVRHMCAVEGTMMMDRGNDSGSKGFESVVTKKSENVNTLGI